MLDATAVLKWKSAPGAIETVFVLKGLIFLLKLPIVNSALSATAMMLMNALNAKIKMAAVSVRLTAVVTVCYHSPSIAYLPVHAQSPVSPTVTAEHVVIMAAMVYAVIVTMESTAPVIIPARASPARQEISLVG